MRKISIILPVYNEEGNIKRLFEELEGIVNKNHYDYEIIAVNDGSADGSFGSLKREAERNSNIKIINFVRNFGQTAAIIAGINSSSGDIIVLLDSDLENDPNDIPKLLSKLDEGYDVVSGWRKDRWIGKWFTRKLPSVAANWLISKISGVKLNDYGCTLKIYRKEIIKGVPLYGEMHRFIPIYSYWRGGKVAEIEVNYRKRTYGKSKYNMQRTFRVILDLILIKFLDKYMNRPIHFFGGLGFLSFFLGIFTGFLAVVLRLMHIKYIIETPLPTLSALFIIVGVQLIAMGIISEVVMRIYYEAQNKESYTVKDKINFN